MFWQLNYQSSEIENLLNKEDVTLFELLNEEDILQECKAQNKKLIDYLGDEKNISMLVDFIVDQPDPNIDPKAQFKLPVRACEILISNVACLNEGFVKNDQNIVKLLSYLNTGEELNSLQASLFAKLFQHLVTICSQQMLEKMDGEILKLLMRHVGVSAIMDCILHIATLDYFSQWLIDNDFVSMLIERFSNEYSREETENVCWILMELMKRWRDVNAPAVTSTAHRSAILIQEESTCLSLLDKMLIEGTEWNIAAGLTFFIHILTPSKINESVENEFCADGILNALAKRWQQITELLIHPPQQIYCPMLTTWGVLKMPVGRVRLLIVELIAVALHHNNHDFNDQLQQNQTFTIILDLYFEYVWNNLLHAQVEACINAFLTNNTDNDIQQLLSNYKLLEKIVSIFKENQKRVGVANLGHLINISNSLQQHLQSNQNHAIVGLADWKVFVESDLCDMNSLNNNPLIGGWVACNEMSDNSGYANEFNLESDIGPKDGRLLRLFGFVEESGGGNLTGGNPCDVFEALCTNRNQQQQAQSSDDDMFPSHEQNTDNEADKMFASLNNPPLTDQDNDDQNDWANFSEIEPSICDNVDVTSKSEVNEGWADFENFSSTGNMKLDGTSVDTG